MRRGRGDAACLARGSERGRVRRCQAMAEAEAALRLGLGLALLVVLTASGAAWGWREQQHERILLRDVQALTLYPGQYTNSRRTSPIPQLQCTGGTAGCAAYSPDVVQCYNKGWDGYDVQWECKAQMDSSYRFGRIEVSCEGYDYPEDPHVLKGSCGLQYTLELSQGGQPKTSYFGGSHHSATAHDSITSGAGLVLLVLFVVLVYGVYKLFLCDNRPQHGFSYGDGPSGTYRQSHQNPPPPGFKSTFTGAASGFTSDSNSGPGFWTGLGAGGLLGYLAGNRRSPSYSPYYNTWATPTAPPPSFGPSYGFSAPSSGTKSTSGYGGTKRR